MNRARTDAYPLSAFFLLYCLATALAPQGFAQEAAAPPSICNQPYALCTSARCIPDPNDPENQAICECTVQEGESLGETTCVDRAARTIDLIYARVSTRPDSQPAEPPTVEVSTTLLTSTFSCGELEENRSERMLLCPPGDPWTDCLDAPCTVDPGDPSQAICRCPIVREEAFLTFGGECDPDTCKNAYWSAASVEMLQMSWSAAGCPNTWQDYVCENQKEAID